jgi:hypothetical protein
MSQVWALTLQRQSQMRMKSSRSFIQKCSEIGATFEENPSLFNENGPDLEINV